MKRPVTNAKSLSKLSGTLVLVGAGKMGSAMLDGWIARGLPPKRIAIIEPQPAKAVKALARRGVKLNPKGKVGAAAAVVIAVKPQTAPDAVPPLGPHVGASTLVLSIMAGRTIQFLEKSLPPGTAIVRAMPNTPAAIGRGITVAVANAKVSARQRKLASDLLAAIGKVEWVGDEKLIDAVTALSGSGPAYVFLVAEALIEAGVLVGLPRDISTTLATQTLLGSARLLVESGDSPETLRAAVTSPGGTTAAGLRALEDAGVRAAFLDAVDAATRRSRGLGS
jgi:pyrroline-5-carboxylate reductase